MNFDELEHNTKMLASLLASMAAIAGIIMYLRGKVWALCLWIWDQLKFKGDMRKWMIEGTAKSEAFLAAYAVNEKKWDTSVNEITEINKILRNGLSHKIAQQAAQAQLFMESEERPIFMCDENGRNTVVSLGYLKLLGIHSRSDLDDVHWQAVLYGPLRSAYLHSFDVARHIKGTLRASSDFQNPYTEEHRGQWKVVAPCVEVNDSLIFTGRFDEALDDKAREIAEEYGWKSSIKH